MTIHGLSAIVDKTMIHTTLKRLFDRYGYRIIIVDAYGWLHAGKHVNGVVELLFNGHLCPPLFSFFERRMCAVSLGGKFKIILVFDGPSSMQKLLTDINRESQRENLRKQAGALRSAGQYEKAAKLLRSSLDITPEIAKQCIDHLNGLTRERQQEIGMLRCVVSINEADPLLNYLHLRTPKSFILSADYDMVPWGVSRLFG